jgi:cell shape-determining protein MreC
MEKENLEDTIEGLKKEVKQLKRDRDELKEKYSDINYYELYGNEEDSKHINKRLAIVVEFDNSDENSKVVVKWDGEVSSIVIHESMANFKKVSLFGTRVLI